MEKTSSHLLPMQMEIIDLDSSLSDGDDEVGPDEFDGPFTNSTAVQSRNTSGMFTDQNQVEADMQQHFGYGDETSASYAFISRLPSLHAYGEDIGNTIRQIGRDDASLSSEGAIHASQPKDLAELTPHKKSTSDVMFDASDGIFTANGILYEEVMHDPQQKILADLLPLSNLEFMSQSTDASSPQPSESTLPTSLHPWKSVSVSAPSSRSHGKALLSPQKNSMQVEMNKRSQVSPSDAADDNSRLYAKSNQHIQKGSRLSYVQPKNGSTGLVEEWGNGQTVKILNTTHGSGEANASGSKFHAEDFGVVKDKNHIFEKERRALPPHWNANAAIYSSTYQNPNFSTKPPHPTMFARKADNAHSFSDLSRNEKCITSSKGLSERLDDVYMYENAPATRTLPQFPGKSNSNLQLVGSSGGNISGVREHLQHDETPIYQEALQTLGQAKLEDDIPEGLLTVSLLKHQKIALAWMVQKEKSVHCAGGILADDQGLGKTISMIALILKQLGLQSKFTAGDSPHFEPEALNLDDDDEGNNELDAKDIEKGELQRKPMASTSENHRPAAGTLVVCPASILRQWARELKEKVARRFKISVLVYHGGARTKDPRDLAKHDVVLTTYCIVTNEVPKQPFVDDEDDDSAQKNIDTAASKKRKQASNARRRGKKKGRGIKDSQVDYGSGPLARVRWFRVILDEAQTIKNHRTQVARACSCLRAKRRWCLSGTPMQNAIDDLYSYFRFLKYDPYAVYSSFCNSIKYPISRDASQGYKKLQAVLRIVMLRRTKGTLVNGEPIVKLPPKSVCLKNIDFSPEERSFYLKLEADSRQQFKVYAAAGTVKQNYANILLMLLRLRQACDHPILVKGYHSEAIARVSLEMARQLPEEMLLNLFKQLEASIAICPICNDTPEDPVVTMCGHVFCYQCVSDRLTGDDNLCPATDCKNILGTDSVFSEATLRSCISDKLDNKASSSSSMHYEESSIVQTHYVSSKIRAAVGILNSLCSQSYLASQIEDSEGNWCSNEPVKAIVFSQWTGMLDLVEISLNHSLLQYRRLDGTMSLNSRDRAVREFSTDPEVTVMLMSLKAGNLGLNMVAACHVILLDLWWNPATEEQAIDRAHRIGQTRPVTVSRITIKDTVEDRILALQEEKRKMVSSAFGEDHTGNRATRLTVDDLKYLFMI